MKNTKMKKAILTTVLAGITIIAILAGGMPKSYGATADTPLKLGIEQYRASGYSYKSINDKIMWKISSYPSGGVVNKSRTIYCIKGGAGFGSGTEMGSETPSKIDYNQYFNLKDLSTIPAEYKKVLPTGQKYNSLVWVLDHSYVPVSETNPSVEQEKLAADYRKELLKSAGIETSKITDDEIDIAQQLAVWYFTNDDEYQVKGGTFALAIRNEKDAGTAYASIGDAFADGDERNEDAITLFNYLVAQAEANKDKTPVDVGNKNPITQVTTAPKASNNGTQYIVGPYQFTADVSADYTIEGKLLAKDGVTEIPYTLLDENKQPATSLKDLMGKNFYLSIKNDKNITDAKYTISVSAYQTSLTYWSVTNAPIIEQPVAEVVRKKNPYTIEINIPKDAKFDLALRKFITKINDVAVTTSREPQVTAESLTEMKNGIRTTAVKNHTKAPLQVNNKDTVLYTIRIYNEGEVNGYAKEITDYLPEGLTLKEGSTINTKYGWIVGSDGKTIKTTYLADKILNAFNGTTLDYKDIEVECTITAGTSSEDKHLKNVADITNQIDENGNTVDRDSIPNNLTPSQKDNYNPGESEKGWGYEDDDDYEDLLLPGKYFDLALRKYITNINGKELVDNTGKYIREPNIDTTPLVNRTATTAEYKHRKDPVGVAVGDIVIYTIRVYNEGDIDGYASEITDYLPPQLEFVMDDPENFNSKYGWLIDKTLRIASTNYLTKSTIDPEDNLIKAFDSKTGTLNYKEVKIKCKVKSVVNLEKVITNIAEVTDFTDSDAKVITDRDSQKDNVILPTDQNLPDYKGNTSNKSILTDKEYHYKGGQDDDDFEKLILEEFDLALRKFITKVNDTQVTNRNPIFTNVKDANGNYIYEHTKEPVIVETTDIVEYTLRIYNEGDISGFAKQVKDDIPSGLEFLPNNATNVEYRWIMLDKDGNKTEDSNKAVAIVTDYLSKEQQDTTGRNNLIGAFDQTNMTSPNYKEVKVAFKVVAPSNYPGIITNIAEIADDSNEEGNQVEDKDSTPDNGNEKEDDIDKEHVKLNYFDLALRKFITKVDEKDITTRIPTFKIDENGKYVYEHTKEPVEVMNGNIVTYTLRIFNEGTKDGYAKIVKDDIPEGLKFLPDNETNKEYRWVMLDKDGKVTEDITKVTDIQTDYLSKEQQDLTGRDNLIKAFDVSNMQYPNYKDLKIAFKVTEPNTSDRILINYAQIADDSDKDGKPVIDIDSTPDKWIEGEDDQDIEKVKVKFFDLALRKWVTQAIIIEDGKETIIDTGHKAEDDPEEVVKVDLYRYKLNKVVVKFRYKIRITNEGEIAGYATEISDYIPEGLKFVQEDNPQWTEVNGKIITTQLKDTLLQPGEKAEVEVLLTWINSENNLGLKVNVAEISKDKNDSNTPDIDSTPNNKKEGEDDIDDAPVLLGIVTGGGMTGIYAGLIGGTLIIIAGGVIFIKKYVI